MMTQTTLRAILGAASSRPCLHAWALLCCEIILTGSRYLRTSLSVPRILPSFSVLWLYVQFHTCHSRKSRVEDRLRNAAHHKLICMKFILIINECRIQASFAQGQSSSDTLSGHHIRLCLPQGCRMLKVHVLRPDTYGIQPVCHIFSWQI